MHLVPFYYFILFFYNLKIFIEIANFSLAEKKVLKKNLKKLSDKNFSNIFALYFFFEGLKLCSYKIYNTQWYFGTDRNFVEDVCARIEIVRGQRKFIPLYQNVNVPTDVYADTFQLSIPNCGLLSSDIMPLCHLAKVTVISSSIA